MRTERLTSEVVLAAPRDQVFAFFSNAANLEALTPDLLARLLLAPDLERIFAYRRGELARRFGEEDSKLSGKPSADL